MRRRNITGSKEAVDSYEYVIHNPEMYKGKWNTLFNNNREIHVEIGTGKGKFLLAMAKKHPKINYIGIEKYSSVLLRALQKRSEEQLNNLFFIRYDAEYLLDLFDKDEISKVYLNFSDPWPKDRHAKRRLTSRQFLRKYNQCLMGEGEVIFKTDNQSLIDFTIEETKEAGWKLKNITYDLHKSEFVVGNIMTEYEEKFVAEGKPICHTVIYR